MKPFAVVEERGTGYAELAERLAKCANTIVHDGEWGSAEVWRVSRPSGIHLRVLTEVEEHDGKDWWHISVSARDNRVKHGKMRSVSRLPSYDELCFVKRVFCGEEAIALQLFPKASEHVNIHPDCLHLWSPIGHNPLPDFRWFGPDGMVGV